jgi:short-subunit dehydrogenase
MKDLTNKNCFITGAANGIGKSFALALAKEGMNLFITDIDMEHLKMVKSDIENLGVQVFSCKCDVTKVADFQFAAKDYYSKFETLDLLLNNAGIAIGGSILDLTLEDWHNVLDVNLWSVINSLNVFLPKLLVERKGHIVNVASGAGVIGSTEPLPYITSKFAVVGLSEALYGQLSAYGINVSVIVPSYIRTTIFEKAKVKYSEQFIKEIGQEKLDEISRDLLKEMQSKAILPDRAVKKYIKGIKDDNLYIYDTKAILGIFTLKGSNPKQYENFLKENSKRNQEYTRNHFLKYGIDIDKYKPG